MATETDKTLTTRELFLKTVKLDLEKATANLKASGAPFDEQFLPLLISGKKVTYDWGLDYLIIRGNDGSTTDKVMSGEQFFQATKAGIFSGDIVMIMLVNDIDIEIVSAVGEDQIYSFKTQEEFDDYLSKMKVDAQDVKKEIGL